ncbi:hypothetical protein C3E77_02865 [Mycetocola zhujimingii]|nr:hypothetical protein C3E77_02865 [Mycetocola zhujimingii]
MATGFQILDAADPLEAEAWKDLWSTWPGREVHAHPSYVGLFAEPGQRVLCATYVDPAGGAILYPFILRPLEPVDSFGTAADIVSPYGYGGPQCWGLADPDASARRFWEPFDAWAEQSGIATEFIRFSLFSEKLLPYPGVLVDRLANIVVPLDVSEDTLWMSFDRKVRKNVKKAERSGVTITVDETGAALDEFMRIYVATMDRRQASNGYYFPRTFFDSIRRELVGQYAYFNAVLEGKTISTELVLVSEHSVYSFLGGTDETAFDLRPNDLLKFEIMRWAQARGKKHFVLGGGASAGDGIERYKRAFSPDGAVSFRSGQRVLKPELVAALVARRKREYVAEGTVWPDDSTYFPSYRLPL